MKTALILVLKFMVTVVAADFVAGFIHWLEDAYVREDTPLVGKHIARPNIVHHHYPRFMTRHTWWQSSADLVIVSAIFLGVAWFAGLLTWEAWLFVIVSANANEFHKWEHRTRKENGRLISFLQDMHILQSARHHARHHTDPKNSHYCTVTSFLNPVLDGMRFWDGLEWALARTIRLERREDTSVRGHGPGPAWLAEYKR